MFVIIFSILLALSDGSKNIIMANNNGHNGNTNGQHGNNKGIIMAIVAMLMAIMVVLMAIHGKNNGH